MAVEPIKAVTGPDPQHRVPRLNDGVDDVRAEAIAIRKVGAQVGVWRLGIYRKVLRSNNEQGTDARECRQELQILPPEQISLYTTRLRWSKPQREDPREKRRREESTRAFL